MTTTTTTMTREYVETLESKLNLSFGYFIRCDDTSAPDEIRPDMYFFMWEEDRLMSVLNLCEEFNLKYDFGFQEWDDESQEIDEILYVTTNYLNQQAEFEDMHDMAGGLWNGKDTFTVKIVEL